MLLFRGSVILGAVLLAALTGLTAGPGASDGVIPTAAELDALSRISAAAFAAVAFLLALPGLRWPRVGQAVLLLAGVSLGVGLLPGDALGERPPDLILITLDTVRADAFDFTGGDVETARTPNLSALAAQSRVFRQAFSPAAITGPAHTSLLSGLHPLRHGILLNGAALPADIPWVPEQLQEAGWHTEAWISAAILEPGLGFGRGFSRYDAIFEERIAAAHPLMPDPERTGFSRRGAQTVAAALSASRPVGQKVFTWIHLYDAHWPYTPSLESAQAEGLTSNAALEPKGLSLALNVQSGWSADEQEQGRALYRAEIADLDALVGEILAAAPEASVIIVGDHGESLGEHDYLFTHGKLAFAPDTHVPLLITGPDIAPSVTSQVVEITDVAATLLALAGLPAPEGSLLGPITRRQQLSITVSDDEEPDPVLGRLSGVVLRDDRRSMGGSREHPISTYLRFEDPRELQPHYADERDPLYPALQAVIGADVEPGEAEAEMTEALRALGYVE